MHIQHVSADSPTDKMYQVLERDGCVVIDGVLDRATIDQVRGEMAPHVEASPYGVDEFDGFRTKRTGMLVARSPTSRDVIMNPSVLDLAGRVLSQASVFQLHCTQIIEVGPRRLGARSHADFLYHQFLPQHLVGREGFGESVGRDHPGMVRSLTAAARQLCQDAGSFLRTL